MGNGGWLVPQIRLTYKNQTVITEPREGKERRTLEITQPESAINSSDLLLLQNRKERRKQEKGDEFPEHRTQNDIHFL